MHFTFHFTTLNIEERLSPPLKDSCQSCTVLQSLQYISSPRTHTHRSMFCLERSSHYSRQPSFNCPLLHQTEGKQRLQRRGKIMSRRCQFTGRIRVSGKLKEAADSRTTDRTIVSLQSAAVLRHTERVWESLSPLICLHLPSPHPHPYPPSPPPPPSAPPQ